MRALAIALLLSSAVLTVAGARAQPSLPDPCAVPQRVKNILMDMRAVGGIEYLPAALTCRNAIVRRHAALIWEVNYCKPSARYEYANFSFRTFDDGGGGIHT